MRNRINENRGITIIHALVGVLIFGVISSIIYSSAVNNLKSIQSETEFQQAYYSVSSAAQVFADSIKDDYVEFQIARSDSGASVIIDNSWVYHDVDVANPLYIKEGDNHGFSSDMYSIFLGQATTNITHDYTISATGPSDNIKDVQVNIVMATDYTVYANFSLAGVASSADNYYMSVKIPVEKIPSYNGADRDTPVNEVKYPSGYPYKENVYDYVDTYRIIYDSSNIVFEKGQYINGQ